MQTLHVLVLKGAAFVSLSPATIISKHFKGGIFSVAPGGGNVASSDSESGDDADYVAGAESEEEEDEEEDEEDSVEDKEEAETAVGEEADEEEEEESSDDDLTSGAMVGGPGVETPGEDSGTTACLALVFPASFSLLHLFPV